MSIPVISVPQMRQWEQATWDTGVKEKEVIRQAGRAVAHRLMQLSRPGDRVLILAGKGHNGDDARFASEFLSHRDVTVLNVMEPTDALAVCGELLDARPAWILDGLFGIGLNRPLNGDWLKFIERVNQAQRVVLSVDVPSGLDAETGVAQGAAIEATITLTLAAPKRGLLAESAWPYVGRLEVAPEIGLVPCSLSSPLEWTLAEDFAGFPPPRPVAGHKGAFGHLLIIAGSVGYHGAAVLAAQAALRARPGLVTVFTTPDAYLPVAAQLQSAMVHPWTPGLPLPASTSAILFGPGLAAANLPAELLALTQSLWQTAPMPVIADASALDWLPAGAVTARAPRLITPHPGEAARMLGVSPRDIQADRLKHLHALSERCGQAFVVLKGHQSLVGMHRGTVFVNSSGNPGLAQGGSGDALAGYLGGLLAQPALVADPLTAIRYAVWQHGAVADRLQAEAANWTVADLLGRLGSVPA